MIACVDSVAAAGASDEPRYRCTQYTVLVDLLWRCSRAQVRLMPPDCSLPGISTFTLVRCRCTKSRRNFRNNNKHDYEIYKKHTSDIHIIHCVRYKSAEDDILILHVGLHICIVCILLTVKI